eukprot:TRINITY_DN653_c0_g1_i1.p1 TRINITY_DN653_c0_g1~~TRINITY_DN653_c0_g1_i1.p1  ORF type:complete len:637 (-),score=173.42 TRINITY_DN653_c0_g1_i1:167-2077(-)
MGRQAGPARRPVVRPTAEQRNAQSQADLDAKMREKLERRKAKERADPVKAATHAANKAEARISAEEAKQAFTRIDSFEGIYAFLDLEEPCKVAWNSTIYPTARHALLAAQFPDAADPLGAASAASVTAAKKLVEDEVEAKDWSQTRLKAMERILRDKFRRSDDLRKKLKETGDRELVWDNSEGDTFWGSMNRRGQNHLGRLLAEVRSNVQDDTEFEQWLFTCCDLESESIRRPPIELIESKDDGSGEKQVHRLTDKEYFKAGKLPSNSLVALHPSTSREHAIFFFSKTSVASRTGGLVIMDLGSKAGTHVDGQRLDAHVMVPLKSGSKVKLGASTRSYEVRVNLKSQIEALEQQQRALQREVQTIDEDAADPIQAAKRLAKEECTVFVGGLEYDTEKADLLGLFQDCGHIEEVRFPGQQEAGGKAVKGIAFVVFDSQMAARRAVGLSGEKFKERRIKISPANEGVKGKGKGGGKGKEDGKGSRDGEGRGSESGSRQFLRDMLDGKWERGVHLPSQSPERPKKEVLKGLGNSRDLMNESNRNERRDDRGSRDKRDRSSSRSERRDDRRSRNKRGRSSSRSDDCRRRRRDDELEELEQKLEQKKKQQKKLEEEKSKKAKKRKKSSSSDASGSNSSSDS